MSQTRLRRACGGGTPQTFPQRSIRLKCFPIKNVPTETCQDVQNCSYFKSYYCLLVCLRSQSFNSLGVVVRTAIASSSGEPGGDKGFIVRFGGRPLRLFSAPCLFVFPIVPPSPTYSIRSKYDSRSPSILLTIHSICSTVVICFQFWRPVNSFTYRCKCFPLIQW